MVRIPPCFTPGVDVHVSVISQTHRIDEICRTSVARKAAHSSLLTVSRGTCSETCPVVLLCPLNITISIILFSSFSRFTFISLKLSSCGGPGVSCLSCIPEDPNSNPTHRKNYPIFASAQLLRLQELPRKIWRLSKQLLTCFLSSDESAILCAMDAGFSTNVINKYFGSTTQVVSHNAVLYYVFVFNFLSKEFHNMLKYHLRVGSL